MFSFFKNIFSSKKDESIVIEEEKFETPALNSEPENISEQELVVKPKTQEELEEAVIENWWSKQNKQSCANHYDLIYSGINMDRFSNLEAKVGKFTFKRAYFGDNWAITIDEKK